MCLLADIRQTNIYTVGQILGIQYRYDINNEWGQLYFVQRQFIFSATTNIDPSCKLDRTCKT